MVARLPFTLDDLEKAVAENYSFKAVARQLGYKSGSASMVKRWIENHQISTKHFGGQGFHVGRSPNFECSVEELADAVRDSRTYSDVCRKLGRSTSGGTHTNVRRMVERVGLDTSHFMTRSEFSSAKYSPGYRARTGERILVVLPPGSNRVVASTLRRLMIESGIEEKCKFCSVGTEWNGSPLVLHVDHKNGSWLDNRLENLRFLCPNCHAQQPTSKSRVRRYGKPRQAVA